MKFLLFLTVSLLITETSHSQEPLFNTQNDAREQGKALSKVLANIEKVYYVNFYYNAPEIAGKYVPGDFRTTGYKDVGRLLNRLLYSQKLDYEQVSDNYYYIFPLQGSSPTRSGEHTSELQSLMRISYAVFCLKKKHNQ